MTTRREKITTDKIFSIRTYSSQLYTIIYYIYFFLTGTSINYIEYNKTSIAKCSSTKNVSNEQCIKSAKRTKVI